MEGVADDALGLGLGAVQDAAGVEDLAARVSYHGTRRVGTLVSLDHEALREIFEMANH